MYRIGQRVVATKEITESGNGPGSKNAIFPEHNYIHAIKGDIGEIVDLDHRQGIWLPTVLFVRTGTSTLVYPDEVK